MNATIKETKKVTINELATILLNTKIIKGMASTAKILQVTQPKCTKKDRVTKEANPYQEILKVSIVNVLLNMEYEKNVTNQLVREGKNESEYQKGINTMPIEFGENNYFIGTYNGQFVLQYRPNPNQNLKPRVKYVADNKLTNKSKLVNFLPTTSKATNQGTDKEILWRKLYLKNIRKLSFNGCVYKVVE